jgi:hypothetical protein
VVDDDVVGEKVSVRPDESMPTQSSFGLVCGCKLTVLRWVLCPVVPCHCPTVKAVVVNPVEYSCAVRLA